MQVLPRNAGYTVKCGDGNRLRVTEEQVTEVQEEEVVEDEPVTDA